MNAASIVTREVENAYSPDYKRRQLMFRASWPVSRDEAIAILGQFVPSYNDFNPSLLRSLPKDCLVTIAREYSVCLYVNRELRPISAMGADEWDIDNGMTRIWWG